jgi:hypothetical protein
MPFTPYHMGPGILIKALLQGSFSLMVFGWAQIVMDIQPLITGNNWGQIQIKSGAFNLYLTPVIPVILQLFFHLFHAWHNGG